MPDFWAKKNIFAEHSLSARAERLCSAKKQYCLTHFSEYTLGYSDVQVGQSKIYALFWGRKFKDIRNNPQIIEGGNMLEVYDLQGNPLRRYLLDKYITGFCIDEKDNTMLALDINNNQHLIKYKL